MTTLKILLVEDETATVELLKEALKEANLDYDLEVRSNGEGALEYLRSETLLPQLLLLDLNLPGKSGLEVLKEIKDSRELRALPVIIFTNSRSQDDVVRAYASHVNAYIRKPMGFNALIEVIKITGKFWFEVASLPDTADSPPPLTIAPKP